MAFREFRITRKNRVAREAAHRRRWFSWTTKPNSQSKPARPPSTPKLHGSKSSAAIPRPRFSTRSQPPASFAAPVAPAAGRCAPTCASSARRKRRRPPAFVPANAASPALRCGNPVGKIRAHIEAHLDRPVRLAELGRLVRLSPFTVQRLFKQSLGASPLQYQRALRAASLRGALKQGGNVTNAIYNAGFGSSSRAYEGAQLGMTPARFAQGGKGEQIGWATARTPFGWMVVGATERGLCWLALGSTSAEAESQLARGVSAGDVAPRSVALAARGDGAGERARRLGSGAKPRHSWTCAELSSNSASGRLCVRFRAARRGAIASLRAS